MATFTVTVPDTIAIGRNAEHGTLAIEWDKIPQLVKDHIATVYFPQYITDAANSKGADSPSSERMALAQKKLDAMLAGRSAHVASPANRLIRSKPKPTAMRLSPCARLCWRSRGQENPQGHQRPRAMGSRCA
jgi:hypothetical protein